MKFDMNSIREVVLSLVAGVIVGMIFGILEFPLPAPPNIPGFIGIFGVWLGATIVRKMEKTTA